MKVWDLVIAQFEIFAIPAIPDKKWKFSKKIVLSCTKLFSRRPRANTMNSRTSRELPVFPRAPVSSREVHISKNCFLWPAAICGIAGPPAAIVCSRNFLPNREKFKGKFFLEFHWLCQIVEKLTISIFFYLLGMYFLQFRELFIWS